MGNAGRGRGIHDRRRDIVSLPKMGRWIRLVERRIQQRCAGVSVRPRLELELDVDVPGRGCVDCGRDGTPPE